MAKMLRNHVVPATLLLVMLMVLMLGPGAAAPALAADPVTLTFQACSNNNAGDVAIGEAQMSVTVSDEGANQVRFTFDNAGPEASSITDVYFDDGTLLGIAAIDNSDPGVDYDTPATPGDLPAGNDCPGEDFQTTANFSADSNPPAQPNGVNPGESVAIIFDLQAGKSFADVISDLETGALRIGIHVQGYASGGSESFVNGPLEPPPPPPDETPPLCTFAGVFKEGNSIWVEAHFQDLESGLAQVQVIKAVNVDVVIDAFTVGTNDLVVGKAFKIDNSKRSTIAFRVYDVAGNFSECDPEIVLQGRGTGTPVTEVLEGVSNADHLVTVSNGAPGLKNVDVTVNGQLYKFTGLKDGQEVTIDVAASMVDGTDNTVTVTAYGKPGTEAIILIWDGK